MDSHHLFVESKVEGKVNYGRAIVRENTSKWKNQLTPLTIKRIEEITFDTLRSFGYVVEYATQARAISRCESMRGRILDLYSMLAVSNRALPRGKLAYRMRALRVEFMKRFGRYRTTG
jgi:hypothetical protein